MRYTYRYRSFIWPALLILAGVVALLVNTGQIPIDRLYQVVNLWPLVLIVIGLEVILRRTVHGTAGDAAAALIVLLAIVGAAAYVTITPSPSSTHTLEASARVGDVKATHVVIEAGAATLHLSGATELGSDLYRARIEYSGPRPEITVDSTSGTLRISQESSGFLVFQSRRFVLDLELNPEVSWTLEANTGATTSNFDLAHLRVTSVTLNSGAARDDITLGPPTGVVPIQVNGGALTVHVRRPGGLRPVPVSAEVSGGAVSLTADGRNQRGVGHLSYASSDLAGAADSYRIEVNGGACTVTLDTTPES
jgi:cell wall-active antibiotic response 4TMS protein YvqF